MVFGNKMRIGEEGSRGEPYDRRTWWQNAERKALKERMETSLVARCWFEA
jgi:hypothetical protein